MKIFRLLSLRQPSVFISLIIGLSTFSIGSWWSVKSAVDSDLRARLNSQADRIELVIKTTMDSYSNVLSSMRGDLMVYGIPSPKEFRDHFEALEFQKRFPGLRAVGFSKFERDEKGNPIKAKVSLIEPLDWRNEKVIGYDLLSETRRNETVLRALATGEPTLSSPLWLVSDDERGAKPGLLLILPATKGSLHAWSSKASNVDGLLYVAFRSAEAFSSVFGDPSLGRENVNFVISIVDGGNFTSLYNRFDVGDSTLASKGISDRSITRNIDIQGRQLRVTVTPLPSFYSFWDRYLPTAIGAGTSFISVLILLVLKASQAQLVFESQARELSVLAANKSRAQILALKTLNDFAQAMTVNADQHALTGRIFETLSSLLRTQAAAMYFLDETTGEHSLQLVHSTGLQASDFARSRLPLSEAMSMMPNRFVLRKGERDASRTLSKILKETTACSDWLLTSIPSQEFGRWGLLWTARRDGTSFDEMEIEILESLVTQSANSIEGARLFRKSEQASLAKNAFLANMSHEIRTPLNAIIGYSEILLNPNCPALQRNQLADSIRRGGRQLTGLIEDILDLSKIETGNLKIELRRVRLGRILEDVQSILSMRAKEKRVQLRLESAGLLPSHVMLDEVRVKQILSNVIGNAIKFTERGSVTLLVRHQQSEANANFIVFRVKDTGVGMTDEAQANLFQPFSQGDFSSTRRFGGSGLGLALSRKLARELGGDLSLVESIPGQGTTFEVKIEVGDLSNVAWTENPLDDREDEPSTTPIMLQSSALSGVKILLVEDSPDNREIFRFFLQSAGALLETVDNGLDAVKRASGGDYDLILMDIQIPEIDGKEATRRIRLQGFHRPIVALTAHAMVEEREHCIQAGCNGQITKPVSGDQLIKEVKQFLGGDDERGTSSSNRAEATVH